MESSSSRARLRRTLRYPSYSSEPDTLDEQEQEALINHLSAQNALQNTLFSRLLLALPLAATLPYIEALLAHHHPRRAIVAVPSLSSLLSTAYLLHRLPPGVTGIAPLDAWTRASSRPQRGFLNLDRGRGRGRDKSPLETYLPYLNAGLVLILALMELATGRGAASGSFAWIATGNLPGVVYAIVLLAKVVMGGVDPETDLSALKYGYRGA
ncbi:hypothetical protein C2857_006410 [Epichloe festucae Fl1]|uniref:Uncharacterized protein n=1 Tax=Epichloe festucae (strain Fl1) TaxID=877507 RepID=A0A7S9PUI3_EPIFF|nr:hypothetical protein C2857_006410 [Epichloe festucae Fl1]